MIAGVDFSTHAIDIAIIPLDPGNELAKPVSFRSTPLPSFEDAATRAVEVAYATRSMLADVDGSPVSSVWVEEPWTMSWTSARALFPMLGSILASAGSPRGSRFATTIKADEWRHVLKLPLRGPQTKPASIDHATRHVAAFATPKQSRELIRGGKVNEHLAEALNIALAGRELIWRHHDAATTTT